ncbi:MAG: hypothetical protein LBK27_05205 [Treponema sp.]|jgi:hypothetical protein|nr:hypothetical protein [Treponema sp.]
MKKSFCLLGALLFFAAPWIFSQTHTAVPVESHIYRILEQAEMRGLCSPLPGARPYTRAVIISAIGEILDAEHTGGALRPAERLILEDYRKELDKPDPGFDLLRGRFYAEGNFSRAQTPISAYIGGMADLGFSGGFYPESGGNYWGTDIWVQFFAKGDVGGHFSWDFGASGGLVRVPRTELGTYHTYYDTFGPVEGAGTSGNEEYIDQEIKTYSQPLNHFPYTYRKKWDGSIYLLEDLYDFGSWPNGIAGVYNLKSEIAGAFLDNALTWRLGRLEREWGNNSVGSSLSLNGSARPFLAVEGSFHPFSWVGISSLAGILEYYNENGIKESAKSFQNAFSITMLEFKYKNYLYLDLGESVVYTKRFELGYLSPITNHIFYQNNIGDFDNMSMFITLKGQYPGFGKAWFSLFWDEAFWKRGALESDGTMIAWQGGLSFPLSFLAFSSIKISYTKIEPYCYTHNRNFVPGYEGHMETSYTNNGVGLGYYLPPNSDELLLRLETMPARGLTTFLQYQLIRHGADFGDSAVDGSSYRSELDPLERGEKDVSRKFFLFDGAYQWYHIVKGGLEKRFAKLPLALYGEAGIFVSLFTNIDGPANSGKAPSYHAIDEDPYVRSVNYIVGFGIKIFPEY